MGSSSEEELKSVEHVVQDLQSAQELHKQTALKSHKQHQDIVNRCNTQWKRIQELKSLLTRDTDEQEELTRLCNLFSLPISADYQMSKLVPSWGVSPQPGITYYLQKLSHDIFGKLLIKQLESLVFISLMSGLDLRTVTTLFPTFTTTCQTYLHGFKEYTSFSTMQVAQTRTCTQWRAQWRWPNIKNSIL